MITIKTLKQTGKFCPTQWEGLTDDNRPIYIRYRWGHLTATIGKEGDTIREVVNYGERYFEHLNNDNWAGVLTLEELKEITENQIEFDL